MAEKGVRRGEKMTDTGERTRNESVCAGGEGGGGVAQNPSLWRVMTNASDHGRAAGKAGSSP